MNRGSYGILFAVVASMLTLQAKAQAPENTKPFFKYLKNLGNDCVFRNRNPKSPFTDSIAIRTNGSLNDVEVRAGETLVWIKDSIGAEQEVLFHTESAPDILTKVSEKAQVEFQSFITSQQARDAIKPLHEKCRAHRPFVPHQRKLGAQYSFLGTLTAKLQ